MYVRRENNPGLLQCAMRLLKRLLRGWIVIACPRLRTGGLLTYLASVDCIKPKRRIYMGRFKLNPSLETRDGHEILGQDQLEEVDYISPPDHSVQ